MIPRARRAGGPNGPTHDRPALKAGKEGSALSLHRASRRSVGRIKDAFRVALQRPRDRAAPEFARLRRNVLAVLEGDDGARAQGSHAPGPRVEAGPQVAMAARTVFQMIQGAKA